MSLSTEEQIDALNELIRLDLAALDAYSEAIDRLQDEPVVRNPLIQFRADHEQHASDLSEVVRRLGGQPEDEPDLTGGARTLMTTLARLGGAEIVLTAVKSNEEASNRAHEHYAALALPTEVLELIRRDLADERRHLAWVEEALQTRLWEQAPAHP